MKARVLLASLVLVLWAMRPVHAQLIVSDPGVTIQTTLTAASTAEAVLNQILELTGLDEIVLGDDLSEDLDTLAQLGQEAGGLITDLNSIQRAVTVLFDLDTAPNNATALRARLAEIRRLTWKIYQDALAVQTILQSSVSALRHLTRLVQGVGELLGNQQSNQTLVQIETRLTVELQKLREHTAAFHRAQIVDRMADPLIAESMDLIQDELLVDYPER